MKKYNTVLGFITLFLLMQVSSVFAGTIRGTVKYNGEAPKLPEIKMDADPICLTKNTGAVYSQILLLGEGNTLGNVFVHVVGGLSKKAYPAPAEPVILDQKGCIYEPRVIGVMVGQTLKVLNSDGTLHNVHGLPKVNQEFNIAMPKNSAKQMICSISPSANALIGLPGIKLINTSVKGGEEGAVNPD